jgi:hypothetical membrane protein
MKMGVPIVFSPITELPPQNQPIFMGTGDPGQPLSVVQTYSSLLLGQTVIDENGSWLVRCNQPLPAGPFEVTAYSDLSQGYAAAVPFYVGTPAAQQPNTPTTDNTPVLTSMTVVDSLRPLLTGWAPANSTVVIDHSGGSPRYGRVVADSNGYWEHIPINDLAIDANNWADIAMMALDGAGNALSPWAVVTLTVIVMSLAAPGSTPILTSSTTVNSKRPTLTGTAAPNAVVGIFHAGGTPYYGSATADAFGNWSFVPNQDLILDANNQVSIAIAEFDAGGQKTSAWGSATLTVTGTGGGTLPPGSTPILTSSTTVNSKRPTLTGTAAPNAVVGIFHAGGTPYYGSARADAFGNWSLVPNQDLILDANNQVSIAIAEFDAGGQKTSAWGSATLTVTGTGGGPLPTGSTPILTSSTTVNSKRPTLTGTAAPNAVVGIFHAGGTPYYGSARADAFGNWSLVPNQDLILDANNQVSIAIAEFDAGGQKTSAWGSAALTITGTGKTITLSGAVVLTRTHP